MPQIDAQCCIAGGGPAGIMLGYLLGRAGVRTVVLEKHADFLRDFRGDTVHPSTLTILRELGLLEEFLKRPHTKISALSAEVGSQSLKVADFARVPTPCRFIAMMPQWDFLNFMVDQSKRYPALQVLMSSEVLGLRTAAGRVTGVNAKVAAGELRVNADLVVGCDGRGSTVRREAGLPVDDLGSPIDVLWFRLSKRPGDPQTQLGHLQAHSMIVTIDRGDYWQCAYVIAKGGHEAIERSGIEAFRTAVARGAPFLADRVVELGTFDEVKLLSVSVNRLSSWAKPGLLCIGDAAHAMSPVGGVGINLAIQDAVAAANLLADKLRTHTLRDLDLDAVQKRRLWPVKVVQSAQVAIHDRVLRPLVSGRNDPDEFARAEIHAPLPLRLLDRFAWLRRWPAQLIGVGIRPEHIGFAQYVDSKTP